MTPPPEGDQQRHKANYEKANEAFQEFLKRKKIPLIGGSYQAKPEDREELLRLKRKMETTYSIWLHSVPSRLVR